MKLSKCWEDTTVSSVSVHSSCEQHTLQATWLTQVPLPCLQRNRAPPVRRQGFCRVQAREPMPCSGGSPSLLRNSQRREQGKFQNIPAQEEHKQESRTCPHEVSMETRLFAPAIISMGLLQFCWIAAHSQMDPTLCFWNWGIFGLPGPHIQGSKSRTVVLRLEMKQQSWI